MQISSPDTTAPGPERRPTGRRRRMLLRSVPMFAWLVADVAIVLSHRFVPEPRWLMVHLLLLGAVSNAIIVWSGYFTDAILRGTGDHGRRDTAILGLLNLGAIGVVAGLVADNRPSLWIGATLVGLAAVAHAVTLAFRVRASLPARFTITVRYYVSAALMLPVGAWLGTRLAAVPDMGAEHARYLLAHLALNLLGWVGLTIAGTVITLWPTMLRTRADDATVTVGRRAWWLLAPSTVLLAAGSLAGLRWVAVLAALGYLAGLALIAVPLTREALAKRPYDFGTWSMLAGLLWWAGCVAAVAVDLTTAKDLAAGVEGLHALTGPFAAGFVAQVLFGALSYLLPVVVGGGPSIVRRTTAVADQASVARVVLANAAGLVFLLPVPSLVKVTTSMTVYVVMAWTIGVLIATVITGVRRVRRRDGVAPEPPRPEDALTRRRRGQGQLAAAVGVLALLVMVAGMVDPVAVVRAPKQAAVPGTANVTPTGHTTTVGVTAADMKFTPSTIPVPLGDHLVLQVTNSDSKGQTHDLTLANGLTTGRVAPGQTATLDVGVVSGSIAGWCSVAGHKQMGMTLSITTTGGSASSTGSPAASGSGGTGSTGSMGSMTMGQTAATAGPDAVWNRNASPRPGGQRTIRRCRLSGRAPSTRPRSPSRRPSRRWRPGSPSRSGPSTGPYPAPRCTGGWATRSRSPSSTTAAWAMASTSTPGHSRRTSRCGRSSPARASPTVSPRRRRGCGCTTAPPCRCRCTSPTACTAP
nr:hypothetical protein [Raineyella fluvialis]